MIRLLQTFRLRFGKRLILGILTLIFYGESLLAYADMQREPSISIFLTSSYPDQIQAEEILEMVQKTEEDISACFYWDGGITTLSDTEYGRSSQALLGGLYGNALLYDRRLSGFSQTDKRGCVIDEKTAAELFGTRKAEGYRLSIQGKEYQVRRVLPWKQQMILIRPDQEENICTRLFLEETEGSREAAARQFLLSYGLSGTIAQDSFLKAVSLGAMLLFPAGLSCFLFWQAVTERRKYTAGKAGFWIWTGALILLMAAAAFFLWNKVEIPRDWIPGQWSDFSFWQEKFQTEWESAKLYLMLPKTVVQTENILLCLQSVLLSLSSFFLSFFCRRV